MGIRCRRWSSSKSTLAGVAVLFPSGTSTSTVRTNVVIPLDKLSAIAQGDKGPFRF
ncbi:hypothetical protein [Corynebacterium macginleyi]|uniref:hypothetical protein n=1 Tax=Corynebacterium macginleyi TaxID=38290 RepID=UPI00142E4D68|nr:hypothetical protein [Corynebacterium macginleyi]QRP22076.1 hypothetical protein I6J25_04580 [Corynebacterium macginleyi]